MTYTTQNFETGSEFRVQWETERPNPRYDRRVAMMQKGRYRQLPTIITKHASDIFSTYEEAKAVKDSVTEDAHFLNITVRLPGNKNFRTTHDTKKI